jgi:hypothetical protein
MRLAASSALTILFKRDALRIRFSSMHFSMICHHDGTASGWPPHGDYGAQFHR